MKLSKKQKKKLVKIFIAIIVLIVGLALGVISKEEIYNLFEISSVNSTNVSSNTSMDENLYGVKEVVDGDTFKILYNGKETKVRLIGVDTPESVHPTATKNTEEGKRASEYTKSLIEGKKVKLEFDVSQTDKYGRLLAYVYLESGEMLNKKLLEEGYAKIATYPPNVKYVELFTTVQDEAKKSKKGFWKEDIFK